MKSPLASTPSIASRIRGRSGSYCALTSTRGIGRTTREFRRAVPADQDIGCEGDHGHDDRVLDEAEVVVEPLVAPTGAPPDTREREAPDRRADQRQGGVATEGN